MLWEPSSSILQYFWELFTWTVHLVLPLQFSVSEVQWLGSGWLQCAVETGQAEVHFGYAHLNLTGMLCLSLEQAWTVERGTLFYQGSLRSVIFFLFIFCFFPTWSWQETTVEKQAYCQEFKLRGVFTLFRSPQLENYCSKWFVNKGCFLFQSGCRC